MRGARGERGAFARGGFALPLVLVAATASLALMLAAATLVWRAFRGARLALAATQVDLAAERALARAIDVARRDSLVTRGLGDSIRDQWYDEDGVRITVTARRTAPLVVWVSATAASAPGGAASPLSAQAMHARVVGLMAPAWPIGAAAVSNVPLDSSNARRIGAAIPERGQCPDTAGADVPAGLMVRGALLRSALAESWPVVERRAGRWRADAPDDGRWRAAAMAPADSVLVGNHRWTGLVLHDGPLRIVGALTVHGLLVVRGPVDARDGRLSVRGAMLIDAPPASEVRLGPAEIQWDRCAISMALATVADLRSAPFFAWWAVTP